MKIKIFSIDLCSYIILYYSDTASFPQKLCSTFTGSKQPATRSLRQGNILPHSKMLLVMI